MDSNLKVYQCELCGVEFAAKNRRRHPRCTACVDKRQVECQHCGRVFWASNKTGRYCSYDCQHADRRARPREARYSCALCGQTWGAERKHASERALCVTCQDAAIVLGVNIKACWTARACKSAAPVPLRKGQCKKCGCLIVIKSTNHFYCSKCARVASKEQAYKNWRNKRLKQIKCKRCGVVVENHRYCMKLCKKCVDDDIRTTAIKNGDNIGPATRRKILEADGYKCQACKKKTNPKLHPNHSLYPNLDHIVPLAKGGQHVMHNLQCLCRKCNMKKHDGSLNDQLRLPGI
jgi:hypothetical protein